MTGAVASRRKRALELEVERDEAVLQVAKLSERSTAL